ncbi:MAG: type II toxin-antitoxin system death-on-curing family toxin [Anaerolineales bacterium]|nr:type II toxin-antitoxin system death-on-curing family toxin [Anaerolineales bacterium]
MIYLTAAQVLFIHARLIAETGGATGIRDLGLLEAAIARPKATFDGKDLYPDLVAKAAALMASLVRNHPFIDGNKRVGVAAAGIFLQQNRRRLVATNAEIEDLALSVARGALTVDQIAEWLGQHTEIL